LKFWMLSPPDDNHNRIQHTAPFQNPPWCCWSMYMDMPDRNLSLPLSLTHTHISHLTFEAPILHCTSSLLPPPTPITKHLPTISQQHCSDLMDESSSRYRPFVIRVPVIKQVPMIKLLRSSHVLLNPISWIKHCSW
jgi:hypothetical protein